MTPREANTIISKFMNTEDICDCFVTPRFCPSPSSHHNSCLNEGCGKRITDLSWNPYTRSLDALLPVWVKLENVGFMLRFDKGEWGQESSYFLIDSLGDEYPRKLENNEMFTLVQKLAIATAEAIVEQEKEDSYV